jgi:dihydrofolate reductase
MGKINLCIAASLDGYIADRDGKVDFLFENPRHEPDPDYRSFYENVEIIAFGSETYRQITQEISPGKWPYADKRCYVFTSRESGERDGVAFTGLPPREFARSICRPAGGPVWLFGGRRLISSFMAEDLIDQYWLYFMPIVLGGGVPLFPPSQGRLPLRLTSVGHVNGMAKAFYDRDRR